jgi:hypothetical protein
VLKRLCREAAEDTFEIRALASMEGTLILRSSILKRIIVLISNMSDTEGPDFADLPKVMAHRWSFIYLEKPTVFLSREDIVQ